MSDLPARMHSWYLQRSEEFIGSPRIGVIDDCELPCFEPRFSGKTNVLSQLPSLCCFFFFLFFLTNGWDVFRAEGVLFIFNVRWGIVLLRLASSWLCSYRSHCFWFSMILDQTRVSRMLGKHFSHWAASPARGKLSLNWNWLYSYIHFVRIPRAVHLWVCPILNVLMLNCTKLAFLYMRSGWILAVTYGPTYTLYFNKKITYEEKSLGRKQTWKKNPCLAELLSIWFYKNWFSVNQVWSPWGSLTGGQQAKGHCKIFPGAQGFWLY